MNNTLFPQNTPARPSWSPGSVMPKDARQEGRFFTWWHKLTASPEPPAHASFLQREAARKSRLLSTILFYFGIVAFTGIPVCFFVPNRVAMYLVLGLNVITLLSILLNRAGKVTWGAFLLALAFEGAVITMILSTQPLDLTGIQHYDLMVWTELFVVTMLPPRSVFLVALFNSLFIFADLAFHPAVASLNPLLSEQFIPILARPVFIQIIVAGVSYLWVTSATNAIKRADRAEMVATLEHALAEQRAVVEQEKIQLEASIQQLVQSHVESTNNKATGKLPYPESKSLWPLVGVINSLWMRVQHAHQSENDLLRLKQAISTYTEVLHKASNYPYQPIPSHRTRTELDPLIVSNENLQRTYLERGRGD